MQMIELVCVRGKEVFGLTLAAKDTKEALARARALLRESGYAAHPAPKVPTESVPAIALAA